MNPEVKKIGNKLFDKVELASTKVELGIIQDIIALSKEGQDMNTTAASMLDNAKVKYAESLKPLQAAKKLADKALNDAKTLGIEIPSQTLTAFDRVDSFIASTTNALAKLNQLK
jgi:dihydroxyacetone kinase